MDCLSPSSPAWLPPSHLGLLGPRLVVGTAPPTRQPLSALWRGLPVLLGIVPWLDILDGITTRLSCSFQLFPDIVPCHACCHVPSPRVWLLATPSIILYSWVHNPCKLSGTVSSASSDVQTIIPVQVQCREMYNSTTLHTIRLASCLDSLLQE